MAKFRESLAEIEVEMASKEAYLTAKAEFQDIERQRLVAEMRQLFQQIESEDDSRGSAETVFESDKPESEEEAVLVSDTPAKEE